jgi:drug/metabolite transporter (DMT)-like permease
MTPTERQHRFHVVLAFALVYVFWGSTYLGIHIGVEHIPPLLMAGTRFAIAGPLMLLYCGLAGFRVRITFSEALRLAVIGALLLSISNVILAWAEQWVPTGLAALIISITPLWFLVLETWVLPGEHRFSGRALSGLVLGVIGIGVLMWPELRATSNVGRRELFGSLALIGGSLAWALGSVLSKRWKMDVDPFTATGYEMAFAGAINLLAGAVVGDWTHATWTLRGWSAIVYLIIFGSWVGFSAYIWLLKHIPTPKVSTYAYVNPVVAVFLGWLVLHERITGYILAGSAITICAVAMVTGAKLQTRAEEEEPGFPAVENSAD